MIIFEVAGVRQFPHDTITINACSIFTLVDSKFTDHRIYVDNSPVDRYLG